MAMVAKSDPFWSNLLQLFPEFPTLESVMRTMCLIALAALAGCASQPPAESPAKESVTLASAAQPAPAATPASAPAAASAVAATTTSTTGDYKPPAGYKKRVANGQTIYCAKIVVLGSRFPKEDCRSQGELEDMEMQKEGMRSEMSRRQAICGSSGACGSN